MRFDLPPESSNEAPDEESFGLPREARLRRRADFLAVQRRGRPVRSAHFVAVMLGNGLGHRRLGVTVPSRVGNAVERNRVKRWLREIFRHHRGELPSGVDVVLIARRGSADVGHRKLEEEVVELFRRLSKEKNERRARSMKQGRRGKK